MINTPYADIAITINELTNLTNLKDKFTIYVKELNSWVSYDINSNLEVDNYTIFNTYNNIGRWIVTNNINNNIVTKNSSYSISALRSVSLNNNNLLEYTDPLVFNGLFGISITSGINNIKVLTKGIYSDNSWNFNLNIPIFVSNNGILTQDVSYLHNYLIQIALPINTNTLEINKEIIYDNQ